MFYIIAKPHQGNTKVWTAQDEEDFFSILDKTSERSGKVVWYSETLQEFLKNSGNKNIYEAIEEHPELENCKDLPLDGLIFQADYLLGDGVLTAEMVDKMEAYTEYLKHDLSETRIYENEQEALKDLKGGFVPSGAEDQLIEALTGMFEPTDSTLMGFGVCLAELIREYNDTEKAKEMALNSGFDFWDFLKSGLEEYDIQELKKIRD